MKIIHFAIALSMVSALSLGISGIIMAAEGSTGIYAYENTYENNGNQPCDPPLKQTGTRDKRVVVVLAQLPASETASGFLGGHRHDA
jgi:hypothetical protein